MKADVKANKNIKTEEIKDLAAELLQLPILEIFIRVTSKLETQLQRKNGMYFSSDFGWVSIYFDILSQLLWLEITLFSKKAPHKIEKHS